MRVGFATEDSNETYVGLSPNDLARDPYRRYSSTETDDMEWDHNKAELEHSLQIGNTAQLKTTLYRHDFQRNWHRLDGFRQANQNTPTLFNILRRPQDYPIYYNILSGEADSSTAGLGGNGDLIVLDNQRTFYAEGLQTKFNGQYDWGATSHDVELGLRYHQDQIRRTHMENLYQMTGGHMVRTSIPATPRDMNAVRAKAYTFNFLENLKYSDFVFTALGRIERVHFDYDNLLAARNIGRDDTVFAPGLGVLYNFNNQFSIKTSVNRGVSVAGLDDAGTEAKEEAVNYELGLKYISPNQSSQLEVVAFFNDYSNITGTCSSSTGCTNEQQGLEFNGGRAAISGIEGRIAQSFMIGAVYIPAQFNLTLLNAEFRNQFTSGTAEWGVGRVDSGDPLPYIPQVQYTFAVGAEYRKFKNEFAFIYQGESFDQSVSENRLKVPAYGIIDWTGRYELSKKSQVFARIDNLLGKDYIVSYKPYGARPGKPQSFMVGLSYTF
jgi:Fe(3+) dicitrate transport protein